MKAYFDTSAFAAILLEDDRWQDIAEWVDAQQIQGSISDFGWGEFVSAIGIRVRLGRALASDALDFLGLVPARLRGWSRVAIVPADIAAATDMLSKFALGLKLPDAIHIAVAQRLGLTLVSTDIRQVRAAVSLGVAAINPLHTDGTPS
ncbi:type II toxin-antitoxin system VapC family toxin [Sphingomonas glacialis]|uniref:PIN domain-containing protein n=1 Tax=Sphingomonas glacialis TaxID=658225 RepID=A0A502FXW3_9SPHN|nr:type II toxin-antitoxin system VapC family toxin [Sphingomonas glacialis]TPG54180.1 PIN domain-containing protein [Sphingomonas glacialis]